MGSRFSANDQTGNGAHPDSYTMGTRSLLRVKRLKRDFKYPPHLGSTLKKERSYTFTPFFTYMAVLFLCFICVSVLAELLALMLLRLQVNKYLLNNNNNNKIIIVTITIPPSLRPSNWYVQKISD